MWIAPIAAAWLVAVSVHFASARSRRLGWILFSLLALPLLATPWLVPPEQRFVRFLCSLYTAVTVFKTIDLLLPLTPRPSFRRMLWFELNPTSLVLRRIDQEPLVPVRQNLFRIARGSLQAAAGAAGLAVVYRSELGESSAALAHLIKIPIFFFGVVGALEVAVAVTRLIFTRARDAFGNIFSAWSPAEFWRRYNRTVAQWMFEDVFRRSGGMRRPLRATFSVFLVSSLLHEYVFWAPVGEIQGVQTAFFMIQGIGVALTERWRPRGAAKWLGVAGTIAFNLATSFLFFVSVKQIVPW